MSDFLRDPNDPPVAEAPAPEADADGNLPWEQAPAEGGYDAVTSGGEGEAAEEQGEEGEVSSSDEGDDADTGDEAEQQQQEEEQEEPEPEPTLEASAEATDDGEGDPGPPPYYLPPDDQISIDYEVQVQPPPADTSQASVYRHEVTGEPLETHTLVTSGTGQLCVPLTDRTIEDSPLWVRFEFAKEGATRPSVSIDRAFSLAEPEAKTIDATREVVAGQAHALKVGTWGALAYDQPDQGTWFETPEVDPAKVSAEQKADVRWKVGGDEVPDLTGDEVEHTFAEDLAGTKVEVVAYRKQEHARLEVLVGKVSIHGPGRATGSSRPEASTIVPLEGDIQFKAYLDPAELTGATFTWESSSDKVTLTPGEGGVVTARGVTESEEEGDVTLTAKATVNGVEWSATHAVSVCKVPQIKDREGTGDPSPWAPQWHYVHFKAVVPRGMTGTFHWEVSDKLRIMQSSSRREVVTVMARRLSDAAEDQWVKVTFTPRGGAALPAVEHKVTAVAVVFSKDTNQRYGFDNMDFQTGKAPRLSVKKNDHTTVKVELRGPGFTSDHVTFTTDNATIAEPVAPEAGQTEFAMRVNGKAQNKAEVSLRARTGGASGLICATLSVCVYKEFQLGATVYRVHDSTVAATAVAAFDLAAAQTLMNSWYKAAVVKCTLTDGGLIDCNYDKNANGKCELGCSGGVSQEETTVTTAIGNAAGARAVIVKDVNWRFKLTADTAVGDTTITLDQAGFMNTGNTYAIRDKDNGSVRENITVGSLTSGAPATLTTNPATTVAHRAGDYIDWPLAGRSGNPAWVEEGTDVVKTCTLAHELGHAVLSYKDLSVAGLIMTYYTQNNRNLTLRYQSITRQYTPPGGSENQWDLVPRT